MVFIPAFLLGILAVQQWAHLPDSVELLMLSGMAVSLCLLKYRHLLFFVCGLLWASVYGQSLLDDRLAEDMQNREILVEGYINGLPHAQADRVSFDFTVTKPTENFPKKIRLNWYHPPVKIKAGERWRFNVKLKAPYGRMNPGGFDYEGWLFAAHIGASGYVRGKPLPEILEEEAIASQSFSRWRQIIADGLDQALGASEVAGLLKALTIGSQDGVSQAQWQVMRATGTTHLMVISGSHVSLIAGMVFVLSRRLWTRLRILSVAPQRFAALCAWLAALFYAGLAGYSIPTLRAVIMLSVALVALALQRHTAPLQVVLLALVMVLMIDPLAVLSVGFWLSFFAVGLLLFVTSGRLQGPGFWRAAIIPQWAVFIGLSPILISFFQQLSLISPFANILMVPLIGLLIVPLALMAVALLFLWPWLGLILLHLSEWLLKMIWRLLTSIGEIPMASLHLLPPPWYALPFAALGVLLILAPRGVPVRHLGGFLLLPMLALKKPSPETGEVWVTVLDVGQGLSVVVQTHEHNLVYDTGGRFGEFSDIGETVLLPFLYRQGLSQLNTLVLSHADLDHSGGAGTLLANFNFDTVYSSAAPWAEGKSGQYCRAGQRWEWDKVIFTMLSPPETLFKKENNNSCVLKIDAGKQGFLLTGDIEKNAEAWLVEQYADKLMSTVMIAPHHGSKTSSSVAFLQQVKPNLIVIPVGHLNRFGFPHQEVLERYQALGLQWLSTGEQGAISMRTDANGVKMDAERARYQRYWLLSQKIH